MGPEADISSSIFAHNHSRIETVKNTMNSFRFLRLRRHLKRLYQEPRTPVLQSGVKKWGHFIDANYISLKLKSPALATATVWRLRVDRFGSLTE